MVTSKDNCVVRKWDLYFQSHSCLQSHSLEGCKRGANTCASCSIRHIYIVPRQGLLVRHHAMAHEAKCKVHLALDSRRRTSTSIS